MPTTQHHTKANFALKSLALFLALFRFLQHGRWATGYSTIASGNFTSGQPVVAISSGGATQTRVARLLKQTLLINQRQVPCGYGYEANTANHSNKICLVPNAKK